MVRLVAIYKRSGIRPGALEFLYELMKERQTEPMVNISNAGLPTFEHHRAYWTRRPYRAAYLVMADPQEPRDGIEFEPTPVGYVSATTRNEIGIVLLKAYRGRGFGPEAVREFTKRHQPLPAQAGERSRHWLANINPANARSIGMFTKLGFKLIQHTYALEEETHGNRTEEGPATPA